MSGKVEVIPVPTADGGYYVWRAAGEEGIAGTRDRAMAYGLAYLHAVEAREQRHGESFWDRVAQAHRWIRPRRAR
jgi:hypothetical protein